MANKSIKKENVVEVVRLVNETLEKVPELKRNERILAALKQEELKALYELYELESQGIRKKSSANTAQKKEGAKVINPGS